jgi:hypothetical protein
MAIALIAAALLLRPPEALPDARALYAQCRAYVDSQRARVAAGNEGPEDGLVCEQEVLAMLTQNDLGYQPRFCAPEAVTDGRDSTVAMARVYLTYFEGNPDARASPDGAAVFHLALAGKWPCPA